MNYAFYLTDEAVAAAAVIAVLLLSLVMLAVSGLQKSIELERSAVNVRHRPAKQNADL